MKNFLKILLGVLLVVTVGVALYPVYVTATQGTQEALEASVSANLYWTYVLAAIALVAALFSAVYSMLKSSKGALKSILSFVAVAAVIAGAYFMAAGHTLQIPNIENGGVFGEGETIITETSVLIAYVAMAGAIVAALVTEVINAFK